MSQPAGYPPPGAAPPSAEPMGVPPVGPAPMPPTAGATATRAQVGLGWQLAVAALILLLALAISQILVLRRENGRAAQLVQVQQDSMRLARAFGPLARETFDTQLELGSRSRGDVPVEPSTVTASAPSRLGARVAPPFTGIGLDPGERARAGAAARGIGFDARRAGTIVRHRTIDVRAAGVARLLGEWGFGVSEAGGDTTAANSITFGDSVSLADVRVVAYALMQAGISVHRIRRFEESEGQASVIEIKNVFHASEWPPLTLVEINWLTALNGPGSVPAATP